MKHIHDFYPVVQVDMIGIGTYVGKARIRETDSYFCLDILLPMIRSQAVDIIGRMQPGSTVNRKQFKSRTGSFWCKTTINDNGLKLIIPYNKNTYGIGALKRLKVDVKNCFI